MTVEAAPVIADLLARGHSVRFQVQGDSMHPAIRANDYLQVDPVPVETIRRGDVILTRSARGLTAHRVVRIDREAVRTRGDNAPEADPLLTLDGILGRVRSIEREGRRLPVPRRRSLYLIVRKLVRALR